MTQIQLSHREAELIQLLGVRINDIPLERLLQIISKIVSQDKKSIIFYLNVQALNIAFELPWYRNYLNQSDISFCDGFGIWVGAGLAGYRLRNRYTPPDWIDQLIAIDNKNPTFYFLGGQPGIAKKAGDAMLVRNPGFRLLGAHHGFFDKTKESSENREIISQINQASPNILLVGFGMPTQECWIMENRDDLHVNIVMPVGALFDYLASEVPRAPRWMTDHGLEWLGRLVIEPHRLWRRYIIGNPLFFWRIFIHEVLRLPLPR